MRSTTKSILSIVSIGLVAASYKYGIETYAAQNGQLSSLGGGVTPTATPTTPTTPAQSAAPTAEPKPSATASTNTPKATAAPKPKPTKKPTSGASSTVRKTGDPIYYNFGTYQVSVTKTNGTITAVDLVQGTYTRVPQGTNNWLTQSAVASQGSSFGNISRATYTTMAFKNALDSALAKF